MTVPLSISTIHSLAHIVEDKISRTDWEVPEAPWTLHLSNRALMCNFHKGWTFTLPSAALQKVLAGSGLSKAQLRQVVLEEKVWFEGILEQYCTTCQHGWRDHGSFSRGYKDGQRPQGDQLPPCSQAHLYPECQQDGRLLTKVKHGWETIKAPDWRWLSFGIFDPKWKKPRKGFYCHIDGAVAHMLASEYQYRVVMAVVKASSPPTYSAPSPPEYKMVAKTNGQ